MSDSYPNVKENKKYSSFFSISCRGKNVLVPILSKQMSQRHWKEVETAESSDNWEKSATK